MAATSNPTQEAASTSQPQLAALLQRAGTAPLDRIGWLRVTGSDRVRWLNGMVTNSVQQLTPGQGTYNFFLNAQGRIQGDGYIFASPESLLVETTRQQIATLIPYLDHYIIMDDVELADVSETRRGLTIIGPQAPTLLAKLGLAADRLAELETATVPWNTTTVTVIHAFSPLVPRFELWVDAAADADPLLDTLKNFGAIAVEAVALEALRIIEGTPLYGVDIRDRDLPQETNQTRALHFAKGCYLGQEIVERIRSRGNVHRSFTSFRIEGVLPTPGTALEAAGKAAGELTSIVSLVDNQNQPVTLALGYARREAIERNEPLSYPGGTAHPVTAPATAEINLSR
ncbi:MAG: folate-binding protein YgfZ [Acidobacteria bacterium]|nr:folate-binding protein YgfZ [Acidobacteriota bacterium]